MYIMLHQSISESYLKLSYYNKYRTYLKPDEDVVTSKISPVNLFTLLHI